ncbi:MAG TPA: LysM peptidoglycan-binding domain-containing protein [Isosphaeraceae bacterium]|nr:LysM peptidoglycan-binding domain-containing protein [Isosphaeraceae bacterium]
MIVVQDLEENLRTIDDIIKKLDVQPLQVLIEAVIISVELDRSLELGVNYGAVNKLKFDKKGNIVSGGTTLGTIGNGHELNENAGFNPATALLPGGIPESLINVQNGKFLGDGALGFPSSTDGIKFGFIAKSTTGFIRALQTLGQIHVLASPRLLVLNKQRAEIQLGSRLGYSTVTQNLTSSIQQVQFLNTGTVLRLRPFVSSDGMVRMEIHPERSSGSIQNNLPQQNISLVTTNVMVPDGATIVIGGLIENEDDFQQQGLPGLNRLPGLNFLFGFKSKTNLKRELIVLLTPHIWNAALCAAPPLSDASQAPAGLRVASSGLPSRGGGPNPAAAPALTVRASVPALRTGSREPVGESAGVPKRDGAVMTASAALPPRAGSARHVVQRGENFWTIARRYYGSGRYYEALWAANRGEVEAPDRLMVGTAIVIPPREQLDPALVEPPGAPAATPSTPSRRVRPSPGAVERHAPAAMPEEAELRLPAGQGDAIPVPDAASRTPDDRPARARTESDYPVHVVRPHETLRSIARAALGDPSREREILELNRDTIADPADLVPGQFLLLPPDARPIRKP